MERAPTALMVCPFCAHFAQFGRKFEFWAQCERKCAHSAAIVQPYCAPNERSTGAFERNISTIWALQGALGPHYERKRANKNFNFVYFGEFSKIMSAL